jgi:hypothetical protein
MTLYHNKEQDVKSDKWVSGKLKIREHFEKLYTFSHCGFNLTVVSASASALLSLTNCRNAAARLLAGIKWKKNINQQNVFEVSPRRQGVVEGLGVRVATTSACMVAGS